MIIKQCSRCREAKPVSEFYVSKQIADGYSGKCKKCCHHYQIDYTIKNEEKVKAYQREYHRQYRKDHPVSPKEKLTLPVPEGFKQVPSYPNYYANGETQQIWSTTSNKLLSIFYFNHGYKAVGLTNENGKRLLLLHRVLAETFIPNPNNYPHINHLDGVKSNCEIANLEWTNPKLNSQHAIELGLFNPADYTHLKRKPHITKEIALEIRNNPDGLTQKQLSAKFNLSIGSISKIHQNRSWKNI